MQRIAIIFLILFQISCGPATKDTNENAGRNTDNETEKSTEEEKAKNQKEEDRIRLIRNDEESKVEVFIDGTLFAAYVYPESIQKPVLFPLNTSSGLTVTRGYPLEPKPWERVDHPHHVGMWLTHGDVNGLDFWGHSDSIPRNRKPHYGTIYHRSIKEVEGGDEFGHLEVTARWERPDGRVILDENTKYYFMGEDNARIVDRLTTLTARDLSVLFKDTKEGMMGIRVIRALELPEKRKIKVFDEDLKPIEIDANDGRSNGDYLNSEGVVGGGVWGQRATWVRLSGSLHNEKIGIIIMDHPDNPNHPTHWHARGYGLFAANPLGSNTFTEGKETLNFFLNSDKSVTFKYRIYIYDKIEPDSTAINLEFKKFSSLYKN
jgi:hypothetical protein